MPDIGEGHSQREGTKKVKKRHKSKSRKMQQGSVLRASVARFTHPGKKSNEVKVCREISGKIEGTKKESLKPDCLFLQ